MTLGELGENLKAVLGALVVETAGNVRLPCTKQSSTAQKYYVKGVTARTG